MPDGEQVTIKPTEYKIKKMKWKVSMRTNYSKYSWFAQTEDEQYVMKSIDFHNKQIAMNNWELFAKANFIKNWLYTNKKD